MGSGDGAGAHRRIGPHRPCDADRPILDQSTTYIPRVRHHWLFRSLATVLSVWLVICLAEPAQLHTCGMHGGLAIDASMRGGSPHGVHGGHGNIHSMAGHSHHDQTPNGQSNQCTCIGDCSAGKTPVVLAAAPTQLTWVLVQEKPAVFSYASPALVSPQFLLPFSNGPPGNPSRA
jgi:hypothetical protein